jgi:hypothetical protein
MTAPKRLNTRQSAIHHFPPRAPERNVEVRSYCGNDCHNAGPEMQNKSAFSHVTGVRAFLTVALRPCNSSSPICHPLKSHR